MAEQPPAGSPLSLPAEIASLEDAQAFLASRIAASSLAAASASRLTVAFEEVFVNICHYAYPDGVSGTIELRSWTDGDRFVLELADQGRPFDADSLPVPDVEASLDERPIGGLGWYLIRRMVSALEYQRRDGRNITRLVMTPTRPGGAESSGAD